MIYENKTHVLPDITMIAAVDAAGGLGRAGTIPWNVPEDRIFFKETTFGHPILMGRKTFDSLGRKALPGRMTGVLTHDVQAVSDSLDERIVQRSSLEALLTWAAQYEAPTFIVGGASLYEQAMPWANRILLSRIPGDYGCDTFFPAISPRFALTKRRDMTTFVLEIYSAIPNFNAPNV